MSLDYALMQLDVDDLLLLINNFQVTPDELDELKLPIQVWCMPFSNTKVRLVTHSNMTREDIDLAVKKLRYTLGEMHVKITKSSKEPAYYAN